MPRAARVCNVYRCAEDVVRDGKCAAHQPTPWHRQSASSKAIAQNPTLWRSIQRTVSRRQHGTCAREGCERPIDEYHHIDQVADGGAVWDDQNVEGLCADHHAHEHGRAPRQRRQHPRRGGG